MTTDALIKGEVVQLGIDEKEKAEKFHRERIAFAIVGDKLLINSDESDDRDHQHWLSEDFGVTVEEFEELTRGYIKTGRLQLFKGSGFECIDTSNIRLDHILELVKQHNKKFGKLDIEVFSGVSIGKVGEIWEPIKNIMNIRQET